MDEFEARALKKAALSPYSLVAVFRRETTPRDMDGARWNLAVSDGHRTDTVEAELSADEGGKRGMEIDRPALERAVEQLSGSYAREGRLELLVAASPLRLTRDLLAG